MPLCCCLFVHVNRPTVRLVQVGRSVDETLRLIQAFQFHAKVSDSGRGEGVHAANCGSPRLERLAKLYARAGPRARAGFACKSVALELVVVCVSLCAAGRVVAAPVAAPSNDPLLCPAPFCFAIAHVAAVCVSPCSQNRLSDARECCPCLDFVFIDCSTVD